MSQLVKVDLYYLYIIYTCQQLDVAFILVGIFYTIL